MRRTVLCLAVSAALSVSSAYAAQYVLEISGTVDSVDPGIAVPEISAGAGFTMTAVYDDASTPVSTGASSAIYDLVSLTLDIGALTGITFATSQVNVENDTGGFADSLTIFGIGGGASGFDLALAQMSDPSLSAFADTSLTALSALGPDVLASFPAATFVSFEIVSGVVGGIGTCTQPFCTMIGSIDSATQTAVMPAVPLPASFLLLTGALFGIGLLRRRRYFRSEGSPTPVLSKPPSTETT